MDQATPGPIGPSVAGAPVDVAAVGAIGADIGLRAARIVVRRGRGNRSPLEVV
jgi:hypothetical protein